MIIFKKTKKYYQYCNNTNYRWNLKNECDKKSILRMTKQMIFHIFSDHYWNINR